MNFHLLLTCFPEAGEHYISAFLLQVKSIYCPSLVLFYSLTLLPSFSPDPKPFCPSSPVLYPPCHISMNLLACSLFALTFGASLTCSFLPCPSCLSITFDNNAFITVTAIIHAYKEVGNTLETNILRFLMPLQKKKSAVYKRMEGVVRIYCSSSSKLCQHNLHFKTS